MTSDRVTLRTAGPRDASVLHRLISSNLVEGHLLPRSLDELTVRASRFIVAVRRRAIVGCAELAPLSSHLAEIRSLSVALSARRQGIGTQLVSELRLRARRNSYERLCVLTYAPAYFIKLGFSIIPHLWVQEKVFTDCVTCPRFRTCGQVSMIVPLETSETTDRDEQTAVPHYA